MDDRHREIRAVFDYSWSLLTQTERDVFARLVLFEGGFTVEAAEYVAGSTLAVVSSLASKSFICLGSSGRYVIHKLLQQYGLDILKRMPEDFEQTRDRHTAHYARFMHQIGDTLKGPDPVWALDAIESDMPNIMTAWRCALELHNTRAVAEMLESLALYYRMRSRFHDSIEVFETARQRLREIDKALCARVSLLFERSAFGVLSAEATSEIAHSGLAMWRESGVKGGAAFELASARHPLLGELGAQKDAYYWELHQVFSDELTACRQNADLWGQGWALYCLGSLAKQLSEFDAAYELLSESVTVFRKAGCYWAPAASLFGVAYSLRELGRYAEARRALLEAREINQKIGDHNGLMHSHVRLAEIAYLERAEAAFRTHLLDALQAVRTDDMDMTFVGLIYLCIDVLMSTDDVRQALQAVVRAVTGSGAAISYEKFVSDLDLILRALTDRRERADFPDLTQFPSLERAVDQFMARFQSPPDSPSPVANRALDDPLTSKQLEVLSLLARGHTNKQIAGELFITPGTVRVHVHQICQKLNAANRTHAVANARSLGLL